MAKELPRFVLFQPIAHPENYLCYKHEDGEQHGFLQFSGKEIVSPYSKFEIEGAKSTTAAGNDNGFVHIRCCFNNKYLVAKSFLYYHIIIAGADEPNEDQSQRSCTLFKPIPVDGGGGSSSSTNTTGHVRFLHVELGQYLRSKMTRGCCYLACVSTSYDGHMDDVFRIIDWESLLILPQHIALKGENGQYLSVCRQQYLQFGSNNIGDLEVWNEVFTTTDGKVRIKNIHSGKFWRRSSNGIRADLDDTTTNYLNTLFYPVKVDDNVIALRNQGNNNFCNSHKNYLKAEAITITKEARLVVEEAVISRKIDNVKFRLSDARIYNQNIIAIVTKTVTNNTQVSNPITLKLLRKDTRSSTWNGSISLKLGMQINIKTRIPLIVEGKVELGTEFTGNYQWGETVSTEIQVETEYTIVVPPMTKVTVSFLATMGSCDVPFSYTQRDMLWNGNQVNCRLDDGIYTGINNFKFVYETKQEKLWPDEAWRNVVNSYSNEQEEAPQATRPPSLAATTSESTVKQSKKKNNNNNNKKPCQSPNEP